MYQLHYLQNLPIGLEEAWDFFSSPENLEKITPENLDFKIIREGEIKSMYNGQLISYTFRPIVGIKMQWVAEIVAMQKPSYFIDEQKFGPYAFWHHEHWFKPIPGGVQIEDLIYYDLPFGLLGKALHRLKVKKDLENMLTYRRALLEKRFGSYHPPS